MTAEELYSLIKDKERYNLHSHTQYCDGHATLKEMADAASKAGFEIWGVTPHSPICVESHCNMRHDRVPEYLSDIRQTAELYSPWMRVLAGMEVDYVSRDFGPHIDLFQKIPLDYRIGSVHFVPTQEGVNLDCDGSAERFRRYLHDGYNDDLRYVVEKYFEQVLTMLELGGFEILGHFDKISGNASAVDADIENKEWYKALVRDVISHVESNGCLVEINTKALESRNRFYPAENIWPKLVDRKLSLIVNSDAHWPSLINAGREEAFGKLKHICQHNQYGRLNY